MPPGCGSFVPAANAKSGEPNGTRADSARPALHKHGASLNRPGYVYGAMGSDTRNAKASALFKGNSG